MLATDEAGAPEDGAYTVDRDEAGAVFSLRERLLGLVEGLGANGVAVMGAGALPFLSAGDFTSVRKGLARSGAVAVTNNFLLRRPDRVGAG